MEINDMVALAHGFYEAFAKGDRQFIENNITDDFTFSAPPDPLLDRAGFFERCWPRSGTNQQPDIKRTIVHENEVVVTYERPHDDGSRGRNTEVFTISEGKIQRVEVYWGWNIEK